jgi:hypothetical protein
MSDRSTLPPWHTRSEPRQLLPQERVRVALLASAVRRRLLHTGCSPAEMELRMADVHATLDEWIGDAGSSPALRKLSALAHSLRTVLPPPALLATNDLLVAFGQSVIAQAFEDIEREARRAGHTDLFAALNEHIRSAPSSAQLTALCITLRIPEAAALMALTRLRRRFRQRVDSLLGDWAADAELRNTLRSQLRASLAPQEPTP